MTRDEVCGVCVHPTEKTQIRKKRDSLGRVHFPRQCLVCGSNLGNVKHADIGPGVEKNMPDFDESLRTRWLEEHRRKWTEHVQQERDQQSAEWHEWYDEYLRSPLWRQRRELVFKRCGGICEGCGREIATQVHHLTYEHVGNEFLWELRAVCDDCHSRAHPDKEAINGHAAASNR